MMRRFALLAAMAVMGLAACSPGESAADSKAVPASRYPVGQEWRYSYAWASPQALYRGSYDLYQDTISTCMKAAGFDYTPVAYVNSDELFVVINPLNEAVAKKYGYTSPPDVEPNDPNAGDDAWYAALTDADGCSNIALTYAYKGPASKDWSGRFDPLLADADRAITGFESTSEGTELLRSWSECMVEKGYDYRTPGHAASTFTDEITDENREVRLADLACDRSVGLTKHRSLFEQQAIKAWADQNALAIDELQDALRKAQLEVALRREALETRGASELESVEPYRETGEQHIASE
jgi:hypothetical protein